MQEINKVIGNEQLTKTERIIRAYILDQGAEVCFMASTDIAAAAGVSEASVIRFARKQGFSGFTDFQKGLRNCYHKRQVHISENITVPYERLLKSLEQAEDDYVEQYALSVQKNIYSAISNNRRGDYERAVDLILKSRNRYVYGSRANFGLASNVYFMLKCMLDNVYFANNPAASPFDNLSDISQEDSLVLFSFPRYSRSCEFVADMAHKAGAKVITITDRRSAPVAAYATVAFTVDVSSPFFFNSFVGVQHVLETLCAGVSKRIKGANAEKLKNIDRYLDILKLY